MLRVVSLISTLLILLFGVIGVVLDAALAIENALSNGPRHVRFSTFPMGTFIGIPFLMFGGFLLFASRVKPAGPPPSQSADSSGPLPCQSPTLVENGGTTDESKKKRRAWLAFWIVTGALFGFAVLSRAFNSPNTDAPKNSAYAIGPFAPRDGGESTRIHFGADKAVAIALEEVKKREGWSGNPDWVTAEADEAFTWDVTVRRWSRTSVGRRIVVVSMRTGKVLNYDDPND